MRYLPLFALVALPAAAQLTAEQKVFDLQSLSSVYAKRYAPAEWKVTLFQRDVLDLRPWIERVRATASDLEFYQALVEYVAQLNDTHSSYRLPSSFSASLGFHVDVYRDGDRAAVMIDSVTRSSHPFRAGDELVSIDGVPAIEAARQFLKYVSAGNERSRLRSAAGLLTSRSQSQLPGLPEALLEHATLEVRDGDGAVTTHTVAWVRSGIPLLRVGPVPMPKLAAASTAHSFTPLLEALRNEKVDNEYDILNYGGLGINWSLPPGSQPRLGRSSDFFRSAVIPYQDLRIGYLRIPNFSPSSSSAALRQLDEEIAFLSDATDGLVLDVMRNTGGDPCYGEDVMRRLMTTPWRSLARQLRAIWSDVSAFTAGLEQARAQNAGPEIIALLEARLRDVREAYEANRGLTRPLSTCAAGLDRSPANTTYHKPILLLTDEFSTSAADGFSAMFQDNGRGKIFGLRTNGAGGSVVNYAVGFYSEIGTARVTTSLHHRANPVTVPDYPTAFYTENLGVHPDILYDFMTVENLRENGRPFVEAMLAAIAGEIQATR